MNSTPIILESQADTGRRLVRTESGANDSKDERWLQELLYLHPELLPVEQFDDAFSPPVPIGRELQTGRGPLDNLYVSPEGGLTLVETKLWKNPEKHRTVVAQIIDYAKELATWDYDQLCSAVIASSRRRGETERLSLEEKVSTALQQNSIDLHEFQESLAKNLAEGNFLLLIVGDRISPNIAMLTKAIQAAPHLGFTLGLVEMKMYPLKLGAEWPLVVVPDVIGRTVEKTRGVVKIRYVQERPKVEVEIDDEGIGDLTASVLDVDSFLKQIPADLVEPYREAMDRWKELGGDFLVTNRMIFFTRQHSGRAARFVRCQVNRMALITQKWMDNWSIDHSFYPAYVEELTPSPVLSALAHTGKQWVPYDKIQADDLRVALNAAISLANRVEAAEPT